MRRRAVRGVLTSTLARRLRARVTEAAVLRAYGSVSPSHGIPAQLHLGHVLSRTHPAQNAMCQLLSPSPATGLPADRTKAMLCGALRLVFEILRRRSFDVSRARRDRDGPVRHFTVSRRAK